MIDLKPCPFCGEEEAIIMPPPYGDNRSSIFTVWCPYCEAEGPVSSTEENAGELWNKNVTDELFERQAKIIRGGLKKLQEQRDEIAKWKRIRTPTHGTCCTCQACGQFYDDCRCNLDELADDIAQLRIALQKIETTVWKALEK